MSEFGVSLRLLVGSMRPLLEFVCGCAMTGGIVWHYGFDGPLIGKNEWWLAATMLWAGMAIGRWGVEWEWSLNPRAKRAPK